MILNGSASLGGPMPVTDNSVATLGFFFFFFYFSCLTVGLFYMVSVKYWRKWCFSLTETTVLQDIMFLRML